MQAASILKQIRLSDGITRAELAALAGISASTVSRIERGRLDPTWGTLMRVLDATGFQIMGNVVVPAGDPSAVASARAVIERGELDLGDRWVAAWVRAGWAKRGMSPEDVLSIGIAAGNAARFSRRPDARRYLRGDWRAVARALGTVGLDYAVSGIVATRVDRDVPDTGIVVYLDAPLDEVDRLGFEPGTPSDGVMVLRPTAGELDGTEDDRGIRFVSTVQAMLDGFAGGGRQPDKAEAVALSWRPALAA